MILNATLLRLDPNLVTSGGDDFAVRCAATEPTAAQALAASTASVALTLVVYVRTERLPPGVSPQVGGGAKIRTDGGSEVTLRVNRVRTRGGRLGHAELWLAPLGLSLETCPCAGGG